MLSINQNRDYSGMSFSDLCDLIDELKNEIEELNETISNLEK